MTHILTAYGREHFFASAGPRANSASNIPTLREVCHSLANINRYTGHTRVAYSVAEHSLLVARIAREMLGDNPMLQLLCLLHDGHECITGDVASPIKQELGEAWHRFETREQTRFLAHYELLDAWHTHHAAVKHYDLVALATERRDLLPYEPVHHLPWPVIDTPGKEIPPAPGIHIQPENEAPIHRFEWATLQAWQLHTAILQTARAAGHTLGGRVKPGLSLGQQDISLSAIQFCGPDAQIQAEQATPAAQQNP